MRVFVTGPTGFIGSAVVRELIQAGHQVTGLARTDVSAKALVAAGAKAHRGSLHDLESLRSGAAASDGVLHLAYVHDFSHATIGERLQILLGGLPGGLVSRFSSVVGEGERRAIEALGAPLAGTDRPLIVTAGIAFVAPGRVATEDTPAPSGSEMPRVSERTALALVSRGVCASVVRLPPTVHGIGDHGFVPTLIKMARKKKSSAYVGEGLNRWSAVHRLDAARLFRLALEKSVSGACYHGIAEEGVPFRDIAAAIGRNLGVSIVPRSPEDAARHFGWFAMFAGIDSAASSIKTKSLLGWIPNQPGLIDDMNHANYFHY